jgi:GNAT superfamily N-acetyltransferase
MTTQLAEYHCLLFCVRDEAQAFLGGIAGYVWGGWLHITMLWLHESARKQGLGVALLQAAEQYGREHDCGGVYLSTFDFQAPQFYQKYGYQLFGQLADCPRGYTSFYLQKRFGE